MTLTLKDKIENNLKIQGLGIQLNEIKALESN
jgi:hypothetical protein